MGLRWSVLRTLGKIIGSHITVSHVRGVGLGGVGQWKRLMIFDGFFADEMRSFLKDVELSINQPTVWSAVETRGMEIWSKGNVSY